jgi:hypothetical protein
MGFQIQDGTGSQRKAKVSEQFRLEVDSVSREERLQNALSGDAFIVGSGAVILTGSTASAILYLQNDGDDDLIISRYLFSTSATNGTGVSVLGIIYKNPTGISGGTSVPLNINNINFGSSETIDVTSEIGAQSATLDGGTPFSSAWLPLEVLNEIPAQTVLPKGSSIGIEVTPPAGSTAIAVSVGLNIEKRRKL